MKASNPRWPTQRFGWLLLTAASCVAGCSSARLDPNSRALTLTMAPEHAGAMGGVAGASNRASPSSDNRRGNAVAGAQATDSALAQNADPASARAGMPATTATTDSAKPTQTRLPQCSILPDPTPSRTDRWVLLSVHFEHGTVEVRSAAAQRSRKSQTTRRSMGRFALELWIGCELIDRVRFDFPLLAVAASKSQTREPNFETSGSFDATVTVPDSDRATRLELVDRANQSRQILDWPLPRLDHGQANSAPLR